MPIRTHSITSVLLFFCLILFENIIAQTNANGVSIQNGPLIERSNYDLIENMIGRDETGYYYFMKSGKRSDLYINHLNVNLENDVEKMITNEESGFFDFFAMMKGNIYSFFTEKKKESEFFISAQKIKNQTLEPVGEAKIISIGQNYSSNDLFGPGFFSRRVSTDESYLLLFNTNNHNPHTSILNKESKNETTFIHLAVFDSDMEKKWDREIEIAIDPKKFNVKQLKIDNSGIVYLLINESSQIHFFRYSIGKKEDIHILLNLNKEDKNIIDLKLTNKDNGDVVVAGLYSDSIYYVHGAFYILIDIKARMIATQTIYAFKPEFIEEYEPLLDHNFAIKRQGKPHKPGFLYLNINEIILKENGELTLIAQQYLHFEKVAGDNSVQYQYYYNDIILVNFDKEGVGSWVTKIPKHQYTVNDRGSHSSFCFQSTGNKIYLIYNDNPANYPDKGQEREDYTHNSDYSVILTIIDIDGKTSSSELEVAPQNELAICPGKSSTAKPKEFLILSTEKGNYEFSKITIE